MCYTVICFAFVSIHCNEKFGNRKRSGYSLEQTINFPIRGNTEKIIAIAHDVITIVFACKDKARNIFPSQSY